MTIKDFGARVADVWSGLRRRTRRMIVGALQTGTAAQPNFSAASFSYDAHADWELGRLLAALDERAADPEAKQNPENLRELKKMADATARVLEAQTKSAEIFIQLVERALVRYDYARVDRLAAALNQRFPAAEICEIVRQAEIAPVRALACEALALVPVGQLLLLLDDPIYGEIARDALEQQAVEYDSDDAKMILDQLAAEDFFAD